MYTKEQTEQQQQQHQYEPRRKNNVHTFDDEDKNALTMYKNVITN